MRACTCKSTVQQNSPISNNHIFITHARYSTNHLQITVPQWRPVIDFWPRARATAATVYNCTGINIPGQIGQVITRYPHNMFFKITAGYILTETYDPPVPTQKIVPSYLNRLR